MAGIGVKLQKIYDRRTILANLAGFGYSTMVTIAPMFVVIGNVMLMSHFLGYETVGYARRGLFSGTVLYIFIFSLLVAAPFNAVLSRYMSDIIYEEKYEDILPCYDVGLFLNICFGCLFAIPFCIREYLKGQVDLVFVFTGFCGFISLKLAYFTAGAGNYVLDFYDFVCERNSRLGQFRIITGQPPAGIIIVYSVLMIIFIIINKPSFKYNFKNYCKMHSLVNKAINNIIAVMLVVLVLNMHYKPYNGLQINMLDVGQGDSIYVSASGRHNFLFDGGSTDIKSAGQYRVYPALRAMGCKYIDCIFISHTDNDHISAVMELIKMCNDTFSIGSIVMPDIKGKENIEAYMKLVDMADKAGINVCYAVRGYTFTVGELDIKCIHPCAGYDYEDSNDYSAVYCISYKKFSMLMTGDAESRAEDCLINDINKERAANVDIKDELSDITVLKVGHHGSKYATSDKLLKTIKPQYALISCGINNRYGHPHSETLERLEDNNCKVYVTNTLGEIIIRTDGYKMSVHQYLQ